MMSFVDLDDLLRQPEGEVLDFKREWHANRVELLHDLLCLSNAYADSDRCLVIGVADDRAIFGIDSDPNRRTNAQVQDLLKNARLNRIPDVRVVEQGVEGKTIAVVGIRNRPAKPFFVLRDTVDGKLRLRNGVVYTRIGDTNVPLSETAPDDRIELMWRERLGLGLSPLERFRRLVKEVEKWRSVSGDDAEVLHHEDFPDFTITSGRDLVDPFQEDWAMRFPDTHATSMLVEVRYRTTVIATLVFVLCDGCRYRLPLPTRKPDGKWTLDRNDLGYLVAALFHQYSPPEETFPRIGVTLYG
ncbi:MAG: helix-turn-helix domain-containing protein [Myxococcaceae bacterium]